MKRSNRGSRIAAVRFFVLSALIAATASAAPPEPASAPEPDVLLTELVIRPDIAAKRLDVEATLHIANPGGRESFTFLLADWYSSVAVRSRSGPASVSRDKGVVEVRVRRPSREELLIFRLSGIPGTSAGEARPVIDGDSLFLLWSDRFYPVDFDDWSLLRTRVELPESFRVLAPGCRTARKGPENRTVEVFETSEPIRAATIVADNVHGRLPWLMHLLRFAAGDAAFDRAGRLFFQRWRFRSFTLDEFVATLAEGTGKSLDWWRDEWLNRGGVPELTWRSEVAREPGGFRVSLAVRQTGALYRLPLEIGIETDRGVRLERARLDERAGEFRFFSSEEPRRVLVDPRRWLLAKIVPE